MTSLVGTADIGVVRLEGADRLDLLSRISTNDLTALAQPNHVGTTLLTNPKGRVVDWIWAMAREQDLLLRTSPGRGARVREWIEQFIIAEDVTAYDDSDAWQLVVLHGSGAAALAGVDAPARHGIVVADGVLWMRGLDAYGPRLEGLAPSPASGLVTALLERGAETADHRVLELLRVQAGVPAAHRELEREVNPLELRLGAHAVSFDKGCYVGQEVLARMDAYDKVPRLLIGFESDTALPEDQQLELRRDGHRVGRVTTVRNLTGGGAVGLGVVKRTAAGDSEADIQVGGTRVPVRLCDRPFWSVSADG